MLNKVSEIEKRRAEEEKEEKIKQENLKKAFGQVFKGNNGIFVAKQLYDWLNYETIKGSSLDPQALAYLQCKRDLWGMIKNYLPRETRIKVEIGD